MASAYAVAFVWSDRKLSHANAAGATFEAAFTPRMKVALYTPSYFASPAAVVIGGIRSTSKSAPSPRTAAIM